MNDFVWTERTIRTIWRGYVVVPFVINISLNALLPFLFFGHLEAIPFEGVSPTVHAEVIATAILLPSITAMICWPLVKRGVRSGHLDLPDCRELQGHRVRRSLFIGLAKAGRVMSIHNLIAVLVATILFGPIIYGLGRCAMLIIDRPELSISELAVFKAALAGFGGIGVAPFLCMSRLTSEAKFLNSVREAT